MNVNYDNRTSLFIVSYKQTYRAIVLHILTVIRSKPGAFHLDQKRGIYRDIAPLRAYLRLKTEFLMGIRPTEGQMKCHWVETSSSFRYTLR
jgi:hypothetical protein